MRRAKSTVSSGRQSHTTTTTGWRVWLICGLVPALANTVGGKPAPAPTIFDDSLVVMPLWQIAASLAGLSNSVRLKQTAAYNTLADYRDRPYRRLPLHHFDLRCDTCHVPASGPQANTLHESSSRQVTGDINGACTSGGCHVSDRSLNHPVGVTVRARLPAHMPLDSQGRITCLTCHTASQPSTRTGDDDTGESMLVVPNGGDLCNSCHMRMPGDGRVPAHWRFSNKAHLGSIGPRPRLTTRMDVSFDRIDPESMTCVSCHDEITVTVPQENETYRQRRARWATMSDHAIGMPYAAVAGRQTGQFNYPPVDAERIRLFDGKVGCGSCHSLYADNPAYLVVKQNSGRLCRTCHIK